MRHRRQVQESIAYEVRGVVDGQEVRHIAVRELLPQ
jgi:hypothetical protein